MKRRQKPAPRQPFKQFTRTPLLLALGALALAALVAFAAWPRSGEPTAAASRGEPTVAANHDAPGRLEASATTVDLGRVPFDQEVQARYELINAGSQAVRLLGQPAVKTLEGC